MMLCKDCVHYEVCKDYVESVLGGLHYNDSQMNGDDCEFFKDRSLFVELKSAEWIEDEDMYGDPIFRCSNCEARFVLEEGTPEDNEYYYCPTCGAKIQEQALKEREENAN